MTLRAPTSSCKQIIVFQAYIWPRIAKRISVSFSENEVKILEAYCDVAGRNDEVIGECVRNLRQGSRDCHIPFCPMSDVTRVIRSPLSLVGERKGETLQMTVASSTG